MGQFYKGTPAQFLDNAMYKAPYELMASIVDKKDKEIDDNLDTLSAYNDKLKADVLEEDSPQARQKIEEYRNRIDSAIQTIQGDAVNYTNVIPEIREISRGITNDWSTTGKIGTMEGYKKNYLAEIERINKEDLPPEIAELEKRRIRKKYKEEGGLRWNEDSQKAENGLDIQEEYFKEAFDEGFLKEMKPEDYTKKWDVNGGVYKYTHKRSGKTLTRDKIIETYLNRLSSDTPTQYAAQRYRELGGEEELPGYEGINNIGEAAKYEEVKDKNGNVIGQKIVPNLENYWGRKASSAADVFEQKETTIEDGYTDDSYGQAMEKRNYEEAENVIIEDNTDLGQKNFTANSSIVNFQKNNNTLNALKANLGDLAKANGYAEETKEYKAIVSGDEAYIKAVFRDSDTADKYIQQYKDINMEINLQKGAINQFNKENSMSLPQDPLKWTKEQRDVYDRKMAEKTDLVTKVEGKATFNGLNMSPATQKEVKKTVSSHVLSGAGAFQIQGNQGIPSIKLGGANVRYLDSRNPMYKKELDPSKAVAVTYNGKIYYAPTFNSKNEYIIPVKVGNEIVKKTVKVKPTDVLVTYPSASDDTSLNFYAEQGHIQSAEVSQREIIENKNEEDEKKYTENFGMHYSTMVDGKMVNIDVDQDNTAPSFLMNNKKENYIKSTLKIGGKGVPISVKNVTTPSLTKAWQETKEVRSIATSKAKYGGKYTKEGKGPGDLIYRVENGRYFIDSPTQKGQEVTNEALILEIDQVLLYKRN